MVVISSPSAWTPSIVQDFTDSPFTSTVQVPQDEVSQPTTVPVSPRRSRSTYTSSSRGSSSSSYRVPLTDSATSLKGFLLPSSGDGASVTPRARPRLIDWPGGRGRDRRRRRPAPRRPGAQHRAGGRSDDGRGARGLEAAGRGHGLARRRLRERGRRGGDRDRRVAFGAADCASPCVGPA